MRPAEAFSNFLGIREAVGASPKPLCFQGSLRPWGWSQHLLTNGAEVQSIWWAADDGEAVPPATLPQGPCSFVHLEPRSPLPWRKFPSDLSHFLQLLSLLVCCSIAELFLTLCNPVDCRSTLLMPSTYSPLETTKLTFLGVLPWHLSG